MLRILPLARRCRGAILRKDRISWYVSRRFATEDRGGGTHGGAAEEISQPLRSVGLGSDARVALQGNFATVNAEGREEEDRSEDEGRRGYFSHDSEDDGEVFEFEVEEDDEEDEREEEDRQPEKRPQKELLLLPEASSDSEPEEGQAPRPTSSYLHKLTIREVAKVLKKTRGIDIKILNVQALCQWTGYMVFVTGKSTRHVRGLADKIVSRVKKKSSEDNHLQFPTVEGRDCEDWMVVDCGDIVVHVFSVEGRERYNLEKKWGGNEIVINEILEEKEEERKRLEAMKEQMAATKLGQTKGKKKKKKKRKSAAAANRSSQPLLQKSILPEVTLGMY